MAAATARSTLGSPATVASETGYVGGSISGSGLIHEISIPGCRASTLDRCRAPPMVSGCRPVRARTQWWPVASWTHRPPRAEW